MTSNKSYDCLTSNLETARLVYQRIPSLEEIIRTELISIKDLLVSEFPKSAIVLTGSFHAGEGQVRMLPTGPFILSDYDFFVVSRNIVNIWPSKARHRLLPKLELLPISAKLDLSLIWEPLIRNKMTTIGGVIVGGSLDISDLLRYLPAPNANNALLSAYLLFTSAPLYPDEYDWLCAKSLMRAARALLLNEARNRPRHEWIRISSVVHIRAMIPDLKCKIGAHAVEIIQRACDNILGAEHLTFGADNHASYAIILGIIAEQISFSNTTTQSVKHATWLFHQKRFGFPRSSINSKILNGLQFLAESWQRGKFDEEAVSRAMEIARYIFFMKSSKYESEPKIRYMKIHELFASLVSFNPHKIHYSSTGNTA